MRNPSPLWLYRVAGHSMLPTYRPGDLLLGWCWFSRASPRPGQVVVARVASRLVIKRLLRLDATGAWLQGDHPDPAASTDSRHFGPVPAGQIEAVIVAKLWSSIVLP